MKSSIQKQAGSAWLEIPLNPSEPSRLEGCCGRMQEISNYYLGKQKIMFHDLTLVRHPLGTMYPGL